MKPTYYLIADPCTGQVVRRSRKPAKASEQHLQSLRVRKGVWKSYQAGDLVQVQSLAGYVLDAWLNAVRRDRAVNH